MTELQRIVADRLRAEHGEVVSEIDRAADHVADTWPADCVSDRQAVVPPMRAVLTSSGVFARLPTVLVDLVDYAGYDLPADPVAAPPYVVITSRGPLLRATLPPGRLLVRFDTFEIHKDRNAGYQRTNGVSIDVRLV